MYVYGMLVARTTKLREGGREQYAKRRTSSQPSENWKKKEKKRKKNKNYTSEAEIKKIKETC